MREGDVGHLQRMAAIALVHGVLDNARVAEDLYATLTISCGEQLAIEIGGDEFSLPREPTLRSCARGNLNLLVLFRPDSAHAPAADARLSVPCFVAHQSGVDLRRCFIIVHPPKEKLVLAARLQSP